MKTYVKRFVLDVVLPNCTNEREAEERVETYIPDSYVADSMKNMLGDLEFTLISKDVEPNHVVYHVV